MRLSARRTESSTTDCGITPPEYSRLSSSGAGTRKRTPGAVGLPGRDSRSRRSFAAASVSVTTAALPAARCSRSTAAGLRLPNARRTLGEPSGAAAGPSSAAAGSGALSVC